MLSIIALVVSIVTLCINIYLIAKAKKDNNRG